MSNPEIVQEDMAEAVQNRIAPTSVRWAVALLAASLAPGFIRVQITDGLFTSWLTVIVLGVAIGVVYLVLRALYRGRNWVRWFCASLIAFGIALLPWSLQEIDVLWEQVVYASQGVLQAVAVILLFTPSSSAWFRPNNSFKPKPLRGSA